MNPRLPLTLLAASLLATPARGQSLDQTNLEDLITVAPANEVTVDLRGTTPAGNAAKTDPSVPSDSPDSSKQPAASTNPAPQTPDAADDPPGGVTAEVTGVAGDRVAKLDPAKVQIRAPFPPKPLASAPAGWKVVRSNNPKTLLTRDVELAPGKRLTLRIQPHVLVPDADGSAVFSVAEPGYDPAAFYRQEATVAGILAHSIEQTTTAERRLTLAIDQIDQLLISLPNPEKQ